MVTKSSSKVTKKSVKKCSKKQAKGLRAWMTVPGVREASTTNDFKNAVLLVSLTLNAAVFIGWLILRVTTEYDAQVYNFLFVR